MKSDTPRNARGLVRYAAALLAGIAVSWALPAAGEQDGWSLFPPLVAILTAVATGRLALGLGTAIVAAAAISMPDAGGWTFPFAVLQRAAVDFVWAPLRESFQLYILAFTASLVGMVRVVVLAGGTQGIADLLARRALKVDHLITHRMAPELAPETYDMIARGGADWLGVVFEW